MSTNRPPLKEKDREVFGCLLILDQIINETEHIHFSLVEKDHQKLEPFLKKLENDGMVELNEEQIYQPSEKGKKIYEELIQQQLSYIAHFEIYAYVDLEEGTFADPETDLLEDDRWADLRISIAEYKGIDPYRIVFLAMMGEDGFSQNPDWKFDLAMGTLFDQMEEIVQEQITIDELGYEDEEGNLINGKDVIEDVIEQGSAIAQERNRQREENLPPEEVITTTTVYYH